ncbi:MAG: TetR family transcriptional regulator [Clostridia bacterium]|jgi:AcrR family transcriptional regulator|nr:TetR family transcriptional regulator [Clostridia bacterium]
MIERIQYRSAYRSKKLIKNAFSNLLQKKDLEEITVTEIVKLSGLNRGTFYAHYNNLTDVLEEIEKEVTDKILSLFSAYKGIIIANPTPFLREIADFLQKDYDFYKRLICAKVGENFIDKLKEFFVATVVEEVKTDEIHGKEKFLLIVRFYTNGFANMYVDVFKGKLNVTLDKLTEMMGEIIALGIGEFRFETQQNKVDSPRAIKE